MADKKPKIIELILDQVTQEIQDEWSAPREAGSFRASELGDCPRYIQLITMGFERERINPELSLLFRDGHLHHHALRDWLKKVGRVTNEEHHSWKRYTIPVDGEDINFILTATVDGIFNGQYVVELKSINPFSFKALSEEYVMEKYKHYVLQLQAYMDVFQKEEGFLLFKDKAFSGLKIFWFKKNDKLLHEALTKMAKIYKMTLAKKMVKKPYTKSSRECKICPMRIHCWKKPMDRRQWK